MVEFVFMFIITFFKKKTRSWATKHWVPLGRNFYQKQNTTHRYVLQTPPPPNSTNAISSTIEDSIGLAFDTNISNILITGDFNLHILKNNSSRKVRDLCQQFNFEQIINEPTHFTENSSSLIDLILTSNRNTISLSGVAKHFLSKT